MTDDRPPVVHETIVIAATPARVWRALTEDHLRARWWGHLDLDPTLGGRFEERWTDEHGRSVRTRGEVLGSVPSETLKLSWADDDWPAATEVEIDLEGSEQGTTVVAVRHAGWEQLVDPRRLADEHAAGWAMHLRNLRAFAESEPE